MSLRLEDAVMTTQVGHNAEAGQVEIAASLTTIADQRFGNLFCGN